MEDRSSILRDFKICRFCLTEKEPFKNIYVKDKSNAIPLPLQIMACVALEVFANDGMPQLICEDCCIQTQQSYNFKTVCKRSDDALKLFLATGVLKRGDEEVVISTTKRTREEEKVDSKRRKVEQEPVVTVEDKKREKLKNEKQIVETEEIIIGQQETEIQKEETNIETEEIEEIVEEEQNFPESNETVIFEDLPEALAESTPKIQTHCFSCKHCERSFPLQQLLDIHMRQHTRERKFNCSECDKKFFTKHDLAKHGFVHTGNKPFVCIVCDKGFSRSSLLHRHEKVHVAVPKYLCTYCDKTFLSSEDLDSHMKDHKKNRPFHCQKCDKKFAFKQGLERHEVSHMKNNAFKCNYCSESFPTSVKLQRHITTHAGGRPFPCKLCPRTFVLSHHLSRHMKSHYSRKNKPEESGDFKCDVCSMSFKRKHLLINHSAIHSMVNLKCVICNKEFEDAKTVKEHIKTHLGQSAFACYKCEYTFENEDDLIEHEEKHYESESGSENENETNIETEQQNDSDSPRRSQRGRKVKNYADFLKVEDMSETDESYEDDITDEDFTRSGSYIPPVVRSEAVKVYKPKDKPKSTENDTPKEIFYEKSHKKFAKITTLENLGIPQSTLDAITEKTGFVEMKIGQKVIRVQKLMMTKAEVEAMTKQGKLDMKNCKVVVKNTPGGVIDLNKVTSVTETLTAEPFNPTSKTENKNVRTYVKKGGKKDEQVEVIDLDKQAEKENTVTPETSVEEKIKEAIEKVEGNAK